jgi:hypothetical protein
MAQSLMRVGFAALVYVILTVSAAAQSSKLDGHWAGLWRDGGTTAIAVSMHIRGGKVVEYIWDGRLVTTLVITGPGLNVTIRRDGKSTLRAVTADNKWSSTLVRTSKDAWKRKPYLFSDYYGRSPQEIRREPQTQLGAFGFEMLFRV